MIFNSFGLTTLCIKIKSWLTFFILVPYPVSFRNVSDLKVDMGCSCSFMLTLNCLRFCYRLLQLCAGDRCIGMFTSYSPWLVRLQTVATPLCMTPPLMWPGLQGKRHTLSLKGLRSVASCCESGVCLCVCVCEQDNSAQCKSSAAQIFIVLSHKPIQARNRLMQP